MLEMNAYIFYNCAQRSGHSYSCKYKRMHQIFRKSIRRELNPDFQYGVYDLFVIMEEPLHLSGTKSAAHQENLHTK